jgi:hypothetical protein
MDLIIDNNEDLLFVNGDLSFIKKGNAIGQHIQMRLATWLGETPYDQTAGMPFQTIIFQPNTTGESVQFILEQAVLSTPGVTGVNLTLNLNTSTRELTVTGTAESIDEPIDFTVEVTPTS